MSFTEHEKKLGRKFTENELAELQNFLNITLIYDNNQLFKNKIKNDSFINSKELSGISIKDSYSGDNKKIDHVVKYNGVKISNMDNINKSITDLYVECIKNKYSMNFTECIDYDIETPELNIDIYCKKCKSKNICPIEEHKRAADEASDYYLRCEDCKSKFYL